MTNNSGDESKAHHKNKNHFQGLWSHENCKSGQSFTLFFKVSEDIRKMALEFFSTFYLFRLIPTYLKLIALAFFHVGIDVWHEWWEQKMMYRRCWPRLEPLVLRNTSCPAPSILAPQSMVSLVSFSPLIDLICSLHILSLQSVIAKFETPIPSSIVACSGVLISLCPLITTSSCHFWRSDHVPYTCLSLLGKKRSMTFKIMDLTSRSRLFFLFSKFLRVFLRKDRLKCQKSKLSFPDGLGVPLKPKKSWWKTHGTSVDFGWFFRFQPTLTLEGITCIAGMMYYPFLTTRGLATWCVHQTIPLHECRCCLDPCLQCWE